MVIEYGNWPRSGPTVNKVDEHCQKLFKALRHELDILDGKPRGSERPLTVKKNGRIHCCLRVSVKFMPVDDAGHPAAIFGSPEEAKEWIKEQMAKIQAGEYYERVEKHLATIRKRKEVPNEDGTVEVNQLKASPEKTAPKLSSPQSTAGGSST